MAMAIFVNGWNDMVDSSNNVEPSKCESEVMYNIWNNVIYYCLQSTINKIYSTLGFSLARILKLK